MKIIRIPLKTDTVQETNHKIYMGPVGFTCPSCGTHAEVNFSKMIFRTMDFYCGTCGNYYKLTNPAFGHHPPKKR